MNAFRQETDSLGTCDVPGDAFDELIGPDRVTRLGSADAHGQTKPSPNEETI